MGRGLGVIATRGPWFVGGTLAAIALTWLAIELSVICRITMLTRRAAAVGQGPKASDGMPPPDVAELCGSDELGLLAGVQGDLLRPVNDDVTRDQIRLAQALEQWPAVGHGIRSPLQFLLALYPAHDDPNQRCLGRMQQALRVHCATASPSETMASATLAAQAIDANLFLQHVARNAPESGIADVVFSVEIVPV